MNTLRRLFNRVTRKITPMTFPDADPAAAQRILYIGDSKTCPYFVNCANETFTALSGKLTDAHPYPLAISGATVEQIAREIERGALAERQGRPDFILINLGANDVHRRVQWATWGRQYTSILVALHMRWLQSPIYVMRPYRVDRAAECDRMADAISVLVTHEQCVFIGPDERVFLPRAGNTSDGIHPTEAGYQETARQWGSLVLN